MARQCISSMIRNRVNTKYRCKYACVCVHSSTKTFFHKALYFHLSGLPKPVFINQVKANGIGSAVHAVNISAEDIIYTALPLYHSAGGGLGLYSVLDRGKCLPIHGWKLLGSCCTLMCTLELNAGLQYTEYFLKI